MSSIPRSFSDESERLKLATHLSEVFGKSAARWLESIEPAISVTETRSRERLNVLTQDITLLYRHSGWSVASGFPRIVVVTRADGFDATLKIWQLENMILHHLLVTNIHSLRDSLSKHYPSP